MPFPVFTCVKLPAAPPTSNSASRPSGFVFGKDSTFGARTPQLGPENVVVEYNGHKNYFSGGSWMNNRIGIHKLIQRTLTHKFFTCNLPNFYRCPHFYGNIMLIKLIKFDE